MRHALSLANQAQAEGEVPVGAVAVIDNKIVGEGFNAPIHTCDPTAHAEVIALRQASRKINNYRLNDVTLYVTLEPCLMCVGAIIHARINRLVFGALDKKMGAVTGCFRLLDHPLQSHRLSYEAGVLSEECAHLLQNFFSSRR